MKIALERPHPLIMTGAMLALAVTFVVGFSAQNGDIDLSVRNVHFTHSLPELPCRMVTSLRTFPERIDPTCSECR
jgi:hypothetical protein